MLRLWALVTLLGVSNAAAQTRVTKAGDSVFVVIHHVRADRRAQYDSIMRNIWWPAAQLAGKKYPAYGKQIAERRRYAPTEVASDSTYTYLYLYFGRPDVPLAASGGNYVLAAAGFSKAQSDSFAVALRSYLRGSAAGPLVDEPYR